MLTYEKLLNAIDQSIDGIAILDAEGCFQYVNNSHCSLFGYDSIDELLGKHWSVGFNSLNADHMSNEILPSVNSNGHWSGDIIGRKKNGTSIVQSVTITKISEEGILCLCRDETKDINLGRLEYLTTNLGKGIIVEDEFRKIVLANRQFSNLFQVPFEVEDILGLNFLDLVKKLIPVVDKNYEIHEKISIIAEKREPLYEERIYLNDGRILEMDYFPVYLHNKFKGQLWTYTDISENFQLQQNLIEARNRAVRSEKAKTAFLSYMSHEIRTPMNAILGLSEQLSFTKLDETQSFFVKNITDSAKSLLFIINDILDLSKIEAGKMNFDKHLFQFKKVIESVENILRPKAEEKGLIFSIVYENSISKSHISDEIRIRQVLINIISNAIKFTSRGSIRIYFKNIETIQNKQIIQFNCEDTGMGIAEDALVHLFEDFFQEGRIGKAIRESGSGLGLAITNSIVTMMGGEIDIKSNVNKGTKIKIRLPLEIHGNDLVEKAKIESHNNILEGKHVLLAEDNNLNRMLFKLMLNNMKITVDEVENGFDAVEKVFKNKYDLVLMDIQMPVMDGTTALYAILKKFDDNVPVIALTAAAFKSEVKHMSVLGFSDCITKPIDQKSLEQKLIDFFSNSRSNSEKFKLIHEIVEKNIAIISAGDKLQESKLIASLLEEVNMALVSWKESVQTHNWEFAKKILHRQKVMINSIGIDTYDLLIKELEDDSFQKSESEYKLMYNQLIMMFQSLKEHFSVDHTQDITN